MADSVNHPPHYNKHASGIECIDVVEHLSFCLGNAIKYLWRAGEKGNRIEDLKKARWYFERELQRGQLSLDLEALPSAFMRCDLVIKADPSSLLSQVLFVVVRYPLDEAIPAAMEMVDEELKKGVTCKHCGTSIPASYGICATCADANGP